MVFWPKCFKCKYDMTLGQVKRGCLVDLMALTVISEGGGEIAHCYRG